MKNYLISYSKQISSLPTPSSISYLWNMGSMLGVVLVMQIVSGIFLSMHFSSSFPFESVIHTIRDVSMGGTVRSIHANGASFFFIMIYIHIFRGVICSSFKKFVSWNSGTIMFLMLMGAAFLGYVLPWGQMSFWGATVITSLASAVPIIGKELVEWLWGGYSVSLPTLSRFFSLHFILPILIAGVSMIHLIGLHETGSSNPIGTKSDQEKIDFHPFFTIKDIFFLSMTVFLFLTISLKTPYVLMDPDNFSPANPLNTPVHIQPEWYFLFAYAILRSIPNKLGGVVALVLSVIILFFLSMKSKNQYKFSPQMKVSSSAMIFSFLLLTWIGAMPPEQPFSTIGAFGGIVYFSSFLF